MPKRTGQGRHARRSLSALSVARTGARDKSSQTFTVARAVTEQGQESVRCEA